MEYKKEPHSQKMQLKWAKHQHFYNIILRSRSGHILFIHVLAWVNSRIQTTPHHTGIRPDIWFYLFVVVPVGSCGELS